MEPFRQPADPRARAADRQGQGDERGEERVGDDCQGKGEHEPEIDAQDGVVRLRGPDRCQEAEGAQGEKRCQGDDGDGGHRQNRDLAEAGDDGDGRQRRQRQIANLAPACRTACQRRFPKRRAVP